jgi:hypothetical protein
MTESFGIYMEERIMSTTMEGMLLSKEEYLFVILFLEKYLQNSISLFEKL